MTAGYEFDAGDSEFGNFRPLDIIDQCEDERASALNEVCMTAIRIVLPTKEQVDLYCDIMKPVPGLNMSVQPVPDMPGAEVVVVTWRSYVIVRAVVVSKWGMTGKIPYAHTRIVNLRTCKTNFL